MLHRLSRSITTETPARCSGTAAIQKGPQPKHQHVPELLEQSGSNQNDPAIPERSSTDMRLLSPPTDQQRTQLPRGMATGCSGPRWPLPH